MPPPDARLDRSHRLDSEPPAWLETADLTALIARGKQLYDKYDCRSCHEEGENPKSLAGLEQRLGYAAVIEVMRAPQSPMPIVALSEAEQRELATFLLNQTSGAATEDASSRPD